MGPVADRLLRLMVAGDMPREALAWIGDEPKPLSLTVRSSQAVCSSHTRACPRSRKTSPAKSRSLPRSILVDYRSKIHNNICCRSSILVLHPLRDEANCSKCF